MTTVKNKSSVVLEGLKTVREHLEVSRPKLLNILRCHTNTVANIENLSKGASLALASRIAQELSCRVDDLLSVPTIARLAEIKASYDERQAMQSRATADSLKGEKGAA